MTELVLLPLLIGFGSGLALIAGGGIAARWLRWRRDHP